MLTVATPPLCVTVHAAPIKLTVCAVPTVDPSSWYIIPEIPPPPPDAVTVTTPADAADTERFVPKLIVPMVPTSVPSSLIMIPVPEAVTPVSPEPSPTKLDAVTIPTLRLGVPVSPLAG